MTRRALILVEGQTEERFVKDVLAPEFVNKNLFITPTLLVTKLVKDGPNFKGGVTDYAKFKNDIIRLLYGAGDALITTMLDYYRLPQDFPGMNTRPPTGGNLRASHVEAQMVIDLGSPRNYLPFLALHEFEAWLFSSPDELPAVMTERGKQSELETILSTFTSPEDINERPDCAPSKRIKKIFPAYRKTLHGPLTAGRIGLESIRNSCPHFNQWLTKLENYARTGNQ